MQYTVTSIAAIGIAFYCCWDLTLVILATVPISTLILSSISKNMQSSIQDQQTALSLASKSAINCFSNIETVKCFNAQSYEADKYTRAIRQAAKHYMSQANANALQISFVRFATLLMFVQGFWYGFHLVKDGRKSTGDVVTTFWSCLTATQSFEDILPYVLVLEKARAAGAALRALTHPATNNAYSLDDDQKFEPEKCLGDIALDNVRGHLFARPLSLIHLAGLFRVSCATSSKSSTQRELAFPCRDYHLSRRQKWKWKK